MGMGRILHPARRGFCCRGLVLGLGVLGLAALLSSGCKRPPSDRLQGYVEGEYVYVAAPLAGVLQTLSVQRGTSVGAGQPLFTLDRTPQQAARDNAARRVTQARADLDDAKRGRRPTEIEALQAQIQGAQAALVYSETELARVRKLLGSGAIGPQDMDRAQAARDQDAQHVVQLQADLKTAQLGARSDQIAAAEANVRAVEAELTRAEWDLKQQAQVAPVEALVFDTLYREGEWVAAGRPVVALLPPANVKVRAFVPEARVGALRLGQSVRVTIDGPPQGLAGKISFISPQAEFTPPVIYSQESRGKLVFMVEVVFERATAGQLHPGQPVDVELGP